MLAFFPDLSFLVASNFSKPEFIALIKDITEIYVFNECQLFAHRMFPSRASFPTTSILLCKSLTALGMAVANGSE